MGEVSPCGNTSGVGIRNQKRLPRFLQKPQAQGTEAPIMISHDCPPPAKGVNEWATVTDALTNVLFDGITDRGGEKDLDTNRLLPDTLYILRGFGMFRIEAWVRPVGGSVGKQVAPSAKQRRRGV